MKKNFLYYAMAAFVAVSLAACGSDSDDSPAGDNPQPSYPTPTYASTAAAFTIATAQAPTTTDGAKLTGINITESGKAVFEVTKGGRKLYAAYNVTKVEGGTYTIQGAGTVSSSTTRTSKGTSLGISVTITIDNQTYTFQTEEDVQAQIVYEQMAGGSNLDMIARTWKVKSMKLTLSGDITALSLPVQGGNLSQFVDEVKKQFTCRLDVRSILNNFFAYIFAKDHFVKTDDRIDRRSDLVAHVREETVLSLVEHLDLIVLFSGSNELFVETISRIKHR